jgi:hypothetical protein
VLPELMQTGPKKKKKKNKTGRIFFPTLRYSLNTNLKGFWYD